MGYIGQDEDHLESPGTPSCDSLQTSNPMQSSGVTPFLAPGKRGWPLTSNHHVVLATCHSPYLTPSSENRNWVRLAWVTCYEMLRSSKPLARRADPTYSIVAECLSPPL